MFFYCQRTIIRNTSRTRSAITVGRNVIPRGVAPRRRRHLLVRVMTPAQALKAGADYLVIGRPITGAEEPKVAWAKICHELADI